MTCILGPVLLNEQKYYKLNNELFSKHSELRKHRFDLIVNKDILYHFETYRFSDKSRQIHCLLKDGSILIFNKKNKKIITAILSTPSLLDKYINKAEGLTEEIIAKLKKCSKLNEQYNVNEKELNENDLEQYLHKKIKILNS